MSRLNIGDLIEIRIAEQLHGQLLRERGRWGATPRRATAFAEAFGIEGDAFDRAMEGDETLVQELVRALADPPEDRRERLVGIEPTLAEPRTEPVSERMIETLGLDNFELAALSCWTGRAIHIELPTGDAVTYFHNARDAWHSASVHLGGRAVWEHDWVSNTEASRTQSRPS